MTRRLLTLAALLPLLAGGAKAADGDGSGATAGCPTPPPLTALGPTETRVAMRIRRREPVTIVAIGSSSTLGVGASTPALSYPSRLLAALQDRFPKLPLAVINRGKGGEDVPEELARLGPDVLAERPHLVIWQVGTNAVLRRDDLSTDGELIERGVARLKESGSDVVLMDLQYAPRVLARPAYPEMEELIAAVAERSRVGLFRRFAIMRAWRERQAADAAPLIAPDGLHMTDRSYGCLAADLAAALIRNWTAPEAVPQGPVAGLARTGPRPPPAANGGER